MRQHCGITFTELIGFISKPRQNRIGTPVLLIVCAHARTRLHRISRIYGVLK